MKHDLIDGVARNALYPSTFGIPSSQEKKEVKAGDYVKLGFNHPSGGSERMWVRVKSNADGKMTGEVNNDPILFDNVKDGDPVEFESKHILGILPEDFEDKE